jgi:YggT family protein
MDVVLLPLIHVVSYVIYLYSWVLIIAVAMSWLVNFNIINTRQRAVYMVMDVLHRITEPALRPIRRFLPDMGGLDISPIVLIIVLFFAQEVLDRLGAKIAGF